MVKDRNAERHSRKLKQKLQTLHPMRMAYWDLVFDLADRIYILLLVSLRQGGYHHLTQPSARELATEVIFLLIEQKILDPSKDIDTVIAEVDASVKKFAEAKVLAQRACTLVS